MPAHRRALAVLLGLAPLVFASSPARPAAESADFTTPPRQVLRVHIDFNYGGHGITYKEEDLFVASTRLVTSVVLTYDSAAPDPFDIWVPQNSSRMAKQRLLTTLLESLAANHVESQTGGCSVRFPYAPAAGTYELTWYDDARRGTFAVDVGSTNTCPPEVARIINSINRFALASGAKGFGVPVEEP